MQGDEAFATCDEVEERLLLLRRDLRRVGIDQEPIVAGQGLVVKRGDLVGVGDVDAPCCQDGLQLAKAVHGPMMAVVAEKQNLDRFRVVSS